MRHDATLVVLDIVVIEQSETLRERGFQSCITLTNIQRVGVISDVEQVGHRRLAGSTPVGEAQLAYLGYLPTEIGCWRPVHYTTLSNGIGGQVAIGQFRTLRQELYTHIKIIRLAHNAQHQLCGMDIVFVFRVAAQVLALRTLQRCRGSSSAQQIQIVIPATEDGIDIEERNG